MKIFKRLVYIFILILVVVAGAAFIIVNQPNFGKAASGARLERIQQSPHYKNGKFNNLSHTPQLNEETSIVQVFYRFLFGKTERKIPDEAFAFNKTDLHNLSADEYALVWMGHSSYFLQTDGKKILVDPVFCGYSSPFSFISKAFKGADLYTAEDIPELDYMIITHDHWDHLDYETVKKLFPKTKKIITGLGTGAHLEHWGFNPENLIELDWYENAVLENGFTINCEPARHFSGRGLKRDQAIWASFLLQTPTQNIYIGGDSGYDTHFKKIGEKYDSIDLAILENGQYNNDWKYIHLMPGEQLQAMKDLNAKALLPVHNSKFALAAHAWDEPMKEITKRNIDSLRILTPAIGEKIDWRNDAEVYIKWWDSVK